MTGRAAALLVLLGARDRARRRPRLVAPRAHAGVELAAGEIAIGDDAEARKRAAEAPLAGAIEIEARVERHALDRGADSLAPGLQRAGREPHRAHRAGAVKLDGADDGAVAVDAAGAARAVETVEGEQLAGHEPPRGLGAHGLGPCRAGGEP